MRPNSRSTLARLLLVLLAIVAIREISIRRHQGDVEAWPGGA